MTDPTDRSRTDWWRLGAVGVTAVLLSLIGFSIASRYQPSGEALTPITDSDDTTSTSAAPTTTGVVSPLPVPTEETTTTSSVPEPAVLTLSQELLDFGEGEDSLTVEVIHTQGGSANWQLTVDSPAVTVDPAGGEIAPGETAGVTLSLDRSEIGEGEFAAVLTLSWPEGESTTDVVAALEDNPIIHNPQASPSTVQVGSGSDCSPTRTTVSARVRDTSELESVVARWSPDGSATRETAMSPVGNDVYEGVIGPYETVGSDSVKIVAFDVRGNAGGASISVAVVACG